MRNNLRPALWLGLLCCLLSFVVFSPVATTTAAKSTATPAPTLNQMTVGKCTVPGLSTTPADIVERERRLGLVMDARPFAINQTVGRLSFNGSSGRVTVLHMNPFVYTYVISVAQKEIVTTALNDFVKLLLPTTLGKAVGFESGTVAADANAAAADAKARVSRESKLKLIEARLNGYKRADCKSTTTAVCDALDTINEAFKRLRDSKLFDETSREFKLVTEPKIGGVPADKVFADYSAEVATLRDVEADSATTCTRATTLNTNLYGYNLAAHFDQLKEAQGFVSNALVLTDDLDGLIAAFKADTELKDVKDGPRCGGYKCLDQFNAYALAAREVLGTTGYSKKLTDRVANAEEMRGMLRLTDEMKTKEGLFARTFDVPKKFELSEATVSLDRQPLATGGQGNNQQTGSARGTGNQGGSPGAGGAARTPEPDALGGGGASGLGANSAPDAGLQSGQPAASQSPTPAPGAAGQAGNRLAPSGQVNEVVRIGQSRFALSGGLVYSPLPRRTFQGVKGFGRNAQGNPTGDGSANVVGFGENSSRRLLPMVMLNTRLADFDAASLYFTAGVSAKHDDNVDVEYLFGPSVGLLDNRILFTGGLYGGLTQNLVPDLAVGDVLPDSVGDAKLFRKSLTWKPGFSVSYFFTRPPKQEAGGAGGGGGTTGTQARAAGLRDEIRIGSIPFNLAVGMIYSTLEQRTYNPVVGFARNRQGDLTNGRTLTRIVGLTSSSDSRLTPAVLLHSRLTNFGSHDFYFTSGLTGKKTDNDFDIEYLLGGSVNLYQRKFFLTFGAFAGKQQTLGGDFFEGAALGKTQGVTTQNRYVWKPAFSFSYDVTKFVPRAR